ncbi:MAG: hypothetical protein IMF05_11685 [Proteobacteria bacterium]|nr:hypothetical protein [Pseudomonadota bacterium]
MRMVLFLAPFVLFLGALFVGAYQFLWDPYTVTSEYWTYENAVADDLFERGWLPDFIPASATRIVTVNNLDLNMSHGEFHYDPDDTAAFLARLRPLQSDEAQSVVDPERAAELAANGYRAWEFAYTGSAWEHGNTGSVWVFFIREGGGHVFYEMGPR